MLGALLLLLFAHGQDAFKATRTPVSSDPSEPTARDLIHLESSYRFESKLENDGSFGDQAALQNLFEYSHRFLLSGKIFLRLGVSYERFDFSSTSAPVPNHLQLLAGVIALEYVVGNDVGAFICVQPGFYTENDFRQESFDYPITFGRIFVLKDRLYLFAGVNMAFLRGEYPVLPLAGLIWRPSQEWLVSAVVPEPRVIYSPNKKITYWAGGQLVGWSFRTDRDDNIVPHKLSNAQVDYTDYRAGVGVEFHPSEQVSINLGAGYSFLRRINFERAGEEFDTDPAPYARVSIRAEF